MVRLATLNQEGRTSRRGSSVSLASSADDTHLQELRFNLAYHLQSSLELQSTLESFFNNMQEFVRCSGIAYRYPVAKINIELGTQAKHTISYNIGSENQALGSVIFARDKSFTETELTVIEMLIGVLFYPLRNALLYREAIASSMQDSLTSVGNRAAMELSFTREIKLACRHQLPLSVLIVDVDHFKQVNDTVGHSNGDRALQQVVKVIQQTLRETDQVFRYGGEEFVAILNNTGSEDAKQIAERIRVNVAMSPIAFDNEDYFCTVSIGIAMLTPNDTSETLFDKADSALYQAKNKGRNRIKLWDEANNSTTEKKKSA